MEILCQEENETKKPKENETKDEKQGTIKKGAFLEDD